MKSFKHKIHFSTGEFEYEELEVMKEYPDETEEKDAWNDIDQVLKDWKDLVDERVKLDKEFEEKNAPPPPKSIRIQSQMEHLRQEECGVHKGFYLNWSKYPSKKSGRRYLYHDLEDGTRCFGRPKEY